MKNKINLAFSTKESPKDLQEKQVHATVWLIFDSCLVGCSKRMEVTTAVSESQGTGMAKPRMCWEH